MRINKIKIDFITHYSHLLLNTIFDFQFSISDPIFIHFLPFSDLQLLNTRKLKWVTVPTLFLLYSHSLHLLLPLLSFLQLQQAAFFQADMFDQNIKSNMNNNHYPVKQERFSKFYYLNHFISFFNTFLYDDVSIDKLGNNNSNNADNSKKVSSSYQNGNYNHANKVRDSVYRNKPEKPYHPSENRSLLSYQNGGDEEEEEV